jgi:nucleoside-diphosphate-sugar epimerase
MLVARGDQVTLYNRGIRKNVILSAVEGSEFLNNVTRIIGDRTKFATFESQMAETGTFDCVIDMVCYRPEEAESAIRAFKGRVGQYIFCSTVDVYTKPANCYPIREQEERQPSPTFPYAFNKAACENIFLSAHQRGDFAPITIIRPAHTYGEDGGLIHSLGWQTYYLDRIRKGRPIIVHGDGSSLWATCHRDDVGRAFVEAVGNAATFGQAYHVTGEEWMPWDRYHQGVAEAMDAPNPDLVHIPTDLLGKVLPERATWCVKNFQYNNIFDNTAAHTDLDFRYTISWVEGACRTIQALEARDGIENSDDYPFYDRLIEAWDSLGDEMTRVDLEI